MPDLSDGVNWSEVDANNNKASPNGWPEGMMPSGVNDAARADRGALKRFWDKINPVQMILPSGGIYTFTTGNVAYPTAYVSGEVYCFKSGAPSVGSDQFQVNGLSAKPIGKTTGTGWSPIVAGDIATGAAVQLVYDAALNAGAGAFVLLNPFLPIISDGTGNVVLGNASVNYLSSANNIDAGGGIKGALLHSTGNGQIDGNLTVNGAASVNYLSSANNIDAGGGIKGILLHSTGNGQIDGNLTVNGSSSFVYGTFTNGILVSNQFNVSGTSGFNGPVTITGNLGINGNLSISGTINGHPASMFDTLTARISNLEAAVEDLRDEVRALRR